MIMGKLTTTALVCAAGLTAVGGVAAYAQQSDGERPRAERSDDAGEERRGDRRRDWGRGREKTLDDMKSRARARFARFDENSDGVLDQSEIETLMERRAERRMRRRGGGRGMRRMERRLRRLDANRDGSISRDEFIARVVERIQRRDIDGDGQITDADLPPRWRGQNALNPTSTFEPRRRRARRMLDRLRRANTNGDGTVSRDEIEAAANARFDRWDATGDGALSRDDMTAMSAQRTEFRVQRFIARFGAQETGQVTRDQFLQRAEERFQRRDANGDGVLTRDEMGRKRGGRGRGYHRGGRRGDRI